MRYMPAIDPFFELVGVVGTTCKVMFGVLVVPKKLFLPLKEPALYKVLT